MRWLYPEPMRLLLIRHAESANNRLYADTGGTSGRHADPALTPLGHEQARALADFARTDPTFEEVTHLYCSLTTRAVQTAAPLASALGLKVQGLPYAHETGGLFLRDEEGTPYAVAGKTHAELLTENPHLLWPAELDAAQAWAGGFENHSDDEVVMARAAGVLDILRGIPDGAGTVALVTHGNFTQYLLRSLVAHGAAYFQIFNTGTTLITMADAEEEKTTKPLPLIHWVNRFDHLTAEQISQ